MAKCILYSYKHVHVYTKLSKCISRELVAMHGNSSVHYACTELLPVASCLSISSLSAHPEFIQLQGVVLQFPSAQAEFTQLQARSGEIAKHCVKL